MKYTIIATTLLLGACGHTTATQWDQLSDEIRQGNEIRQLQNQQMMLGAQMQASSHFTTWSPPVSPSFIWSR